jgi:uncharacterized protein YjdB
MRNRASWFGLMMLVGLVAALSGCSNPQGLDSISVTPATQSLTVGQSVQLTATGTYGNASHPSTQDVTSSVTWTSNATSVATVTGGTVTAIGPGSAVITASGSGYKGPLTATATITVGSSGGGTTTGGSVVSIAVIPSSQTVATANQTTQFIAIGTTSSGATEYLTNSVAWASSNAQVATVGASTGLATSVGAGSTTITAQYTDTTTGSVVIGVGTLTVTAGASEPVTSLSLLPSSLSLTSSGQTSQAILLGVSGSTGLTTDLTDNANVTWTSSTPTVATVGTLGATDSKGNPVPAGQVTAVTAGTATIVAKYTNPVDNSVVTASGTVNVSITGTGTSLESITSLTIIPNSITVLDFQLTGQFLAIGTFSQAPYVRDLTNDPTTTWLSSEPEIFPVNTNSGGNPGASAGLVTSFGSGGATIIAESMSKDGTIQTATATFSCPYNLPAPPIPGSCYPGEPVAATLLETLTVYNEGLNTTNWQVTAPSATGTADVLHCGPGWTGAGGSVCTSTYPVGSQVVLTAPAGAGAFGGWSYNCVPSDATGTPLTAPPYWTAGGPNYCVVTLSSNDSVGAIFN